MCQARGPALKFSNPLGHREAPHWTGKVIEAGPQESREDPGCLTPEHSLMSGRPGDNCGGRVGVGGGVQSAISFDQILEDLRQAKGPSTLPNIRSKLLREGGEGTHLPEPDPCPTSVHHAQLGNDFHQWLKKRLTFWEHVFGFA